MKKKVLEILIKEEKKEGRKVIIAPLGKPYDIISIGKFISDVRYIEVKGHKRIEKYASLTRNEFNCAKEKKDKYWIYIVYNIKSINPQILKIQNPIESMDWKCLILSKGKGKKKEFYLFQRRLNKNEIFIERKNNINR